MTGSPARSWGPTQGWRLAFFLVGLPGIVAAVCALFLPEPERGASEDVGDGHGGGRVLAQASWADYKELMVNSSYTYAVFGMAAYTFAIGGMLVWVPSFLVETRGIEQGRATTILGAVTLFAALLGMSVGGWLADRLGRTRPQALFIVPGLALLAAVPFILLGLFAQSELWIFVGIFLAEALMFVNTGPCNAVIGNVVQPNMRAAAYAIAILMIHFLGDIWSPWLIGKAADTFGQADTMATGARPVAGVSRRGPDRHRGRPDAEHPGRATDRRARRGAGRSGVDRRCAAPASRDGLDAGPVPGVAAGGQAGLDDGSSGLTAGLVCLPGPRVVSLTPTASTPPGPCRCRPPSRGPGRCRCRG